MVYDYWGINKIIFLKWRSSNEFEIIEDYFMELSKWNNKIVN